jgi:hypothetical protein
VRLFAPGLQFEDGATAELQWRRAMFANANQRHDVEPHEAGALMHEHEPSLCALQLALCDTDVLG